MSSILPSLITTEERYDDRRSTDFSPEELEEKRLSVAAGGAAGNAYTWVALEPGIVYPAALADIVERIEAEDVPDSRNALYPLYSQALRIGVPALERWAGSVTWLEVLEPEERAERAQVLEIARLWVTEVLHQHTGKPLGVHVLANDTWRL